ncbi:methyl-accepting chemotaxis protein [Chitiniphilus purpureus]|uniref:Methyl-accepting chemotaxis protein n=1 Tax=Chitiniphilus purpureus TaxID=2981137 RepID=A0ABY6DKC1_9NEIS|nr:methyl-accepting chemotaxis protein [Chitiniphilus sp. CD1]UXY13901.1 methyl-accepting chemotaxis protein [Chitiniphilus sp. CD1]
MTLRNKMIALVISLIALMLILGIGGLQRMARTNSHFASTYHDRVVPLNQLKTVADLYAVNIVDTTHKTNFKSLDFAQATAAVSQAKTRIAEQWRAYTATRLTDEESRLVQQATAAMQRADSAVSQLETMLAAQDASGVDAFARNQLYQAIDPVSGAISKLTELQLREAGRNFEAAQREYEGARTLTLVILICAVLLAAGVSTWLIVGMNRKIAALNETLQRARDGNDLTLRAPVGGNDEIDGIAQAYNALVTAIQQLVQSVAQAIRTVNHEAELLAETTQQVALASSTGAEATNAMAAAVEEVTVSIAHVADSSKEAHTLGETSRAKAEHGALQIRETMERIKEIDRVVGETSGKVMTLGRDAQHITSVVAVIKDVADQTNLLALNAAIEAARAGEQGRGFAVVADEVRKLAERTASATVDIQKMVAQIGTTSEQAVGSMQETATRSHECADLAHRAGDSMDEISQSMQAGEEAVANIANALREHKAGTQLIAQQVERVAQITEENTAAVATMNASAGTLGGLTQQLTAQVMRFRFQGS